MYPKIKRFRSSKRSIPFKYRSITFKDGKKIDFKRNFLRRFFNPVYMKNF